MGRQLHPAVPGKSGWPWLEITPPELPFVLLLFGLPGSTTEAVPERLSNLCSQKYQRFLLKHPLGADAATLIHALF